MRRHVGAITLLLFSWMSGGCDNHKAKIAVEQMNVFKTGLEAYHADWGAYPTALKDITITQYGRDGKGWGPYVELKPTDPWGHPYLYHPSTMPNTPPDVVSAGPDGQEGTGDDVRP